MDFEIERIRLGWNAERQSELDSLGDGALVAARGPPWS